MPNNIPSVGRTMMLLACLGSFFACQEEKSEKEEDGIERTGSLRFVALGDAGEGNDAQYKVAGAMANLCAEKGCDFAIYLGDNF